MRRCVKRGTNFLGVLASDQLPKQDLVKLPAMAIINTHPSTKPGEHWLAIFISSKKHGYFFDSFGNSPDYKHFPASIKRFLSRNCHTTSHSVKQVQSNFSMACGQHCVFFLFNIQRGVSYKKLLNVYSNNLSSNDAMVCRFVKRIQPTACKKNTFPCVQCVKNKRQRQ